jgi:hypothetical protein
VNAEAPGGDFIWATRGRDWGFRFLRDAGLPDPLMTYEAAFSALGDEPDCFTKKGDVVALRMRDPEGRRDAAGRMIFHEFVLLRHVGVDVITAEDARRTVWPLVEAEYATIWGEEPSFRR